MTPEEEKELRTAEENWREEGGAFMVKADDKVRMWLEAIWNEKVRASNQSFKIRLVVGWGLFVSFWIVSLTGLRLHVLLVLSLAAGCLEMWSARQRYWVEWLNGNNGYGATEQRKNVAKHKAFETLAVGGTARHVFVQRAAFSMALRMMVVHWRQLIAQSSGKSAVLCYRIGTLELALKGIITRVARDITIGAHVVLSVVAGIWALLWSAWFLRFGGVTRHTYKAQSEATGRLLPLNALRSGTRRLIRHQPGFGLYEWERSARSSDTRIKPQRVIRRCGWFRAASCSAAAQYHTVVGYFVCRAATHHRSLRSLSTPTFTKTFLRPRPATG